MKFLIVGGARFIGINLASFLASRQHHITISDSLDSFHKKEFIDLMNNHKNIKIRRDITKKSLEKIDGIFLISKDRQENVSQHSIYDNLVKSFKIFNINKNIKKKIIFFSSSEVYGEGFKDERHLKEEDNLEIGCPINLKFGSRCSILMNEFIGMSYDFPIIIVRPFNISGKYQTSDLEVIPRFTQYALKNENIIIRGNEDSIRSFCHVDDAIIAIYRLMLADHINKEIFNIGNPDNVVKVKHLAEIIKTITKSNSEIIYNNESKEEATYRVPSIEKVKNAISWKPIKSLEEIIRDCVHSNSIF